MAGVANGAFCIAHISDLHCGGPHFVPTLLERAISEINDMKPDLVVCSGDLTTFGFKPEYVQAKSYLDKIECESLVIVPGNHDEIGRASCRERGKIEGGSGSEEW